MVLKLKKRSCNNTREYWERILISVNVVGSTGPIKFVVKEDDTAYKVIETALKLYARQARFPALSSDPNTFLLYCVHLPQPDALDPSERIGEKQTRSFVLCKKQESYGELGSERKSKGAAGKIGSFWKTWLNKSFRLKMILSHR